MKHQKGTTMTESNGMGLQSLDRLRILMLILIIYFLIFHISIFYFCYSRLIRVDLLPIEKKSNLF